MSTVRRAGDRPCLRWDGGTITYSDMAARAARIAGSLGDAPRVAILAGRNPTAFAGVLGTLLAGGAYVPLHLDFPAARNRLILERSGATAVVADREGVARLVEILADVAPPILVVADTSEETPATIAPGHPVTRSQDASNSLPRQPETVPADAVAYVMFTSGSTGVPKGVAVSHRNVRAFVERMSARYALTPDDRLSQMFDLTFDLSVFDQFMAWEAGAVLVCPSSADMLNPARFIAERELTVWFSVPSVAMFMRRLGGLSPGSFPSLRWSLFCGEPLPVEVAVAWSHAAPASRVENLYGPTELTIACTAYRWDAEVSPGECVHGLVPIGEPLPGLRAVVVDSSLREVPTGGQGELAIGGDQVTLGYWNDPDRTKAAFVTPAGTSATHYRTGDLVTRPHERGPLCYLGRLDHQIKILGHRVELLEIEAELRAATGRDAVAAVGWPRTASGVGGVVAFVAGSGLDVRGVRAALRATLPPYMVPRQIRALPELPLNSNGKVDRRALETLLEDGVGA